MVDSAGEGIAVDCTTATLEPGEQACHNISCQLELHWLSSLLLDLYRPGTDVASGYHVANLDLHQVAAA